MRPLTTQPSAVPPGGVGQSSEVWPALAPAGRRAADRGVVHVVDVDVRVGREVRVDRDAHQPAVAVVVDLACAGRRTAWRVVSERLVNVLMIPLFSATKTRPLGANSIAIGLDQAGEGGRLLEAGRAGSRRARPPAPVSASAPAASRPAQRAALRQATGASEVRSAWLPAPVPARRTGRSANPAGGEGSTDAGDRPGASLGNEDALAGEDACCRGCRRRRRGRRRAPRSAPAPRPSARPRRPRPGSHGVERRGTPSRRRRRARSSVGAHGTVTGSVTSSIVAGSSAPARCSRSVSAQRRRGPAARRRSRQQGREPSRTSDSCDVERHVGLVLGRRGDPRPDRVADAIPPRPPACRSRPACRP